MPRRRDAKDIFPRTPTYSWVRPHYASAEILPIAGFPLWVERSRQISAVPPHTHDFVELVYVAHGQGFHTADGRGKPQSVVPGDCIIIARGDSHAYAGNQELDLVNVLFQPEVLAGHYRDLMDVPGLLPFFLDPPARGKSEEPGFRDRLHLGIAERLPVEACLTAMLEEQAARPIGFTQRIRARFVELLVLISRAYDQQRCAAAGTSASHHPGADDAIHQAIALMEREYHDELYLEQIAHRVFLSPGHFAELFRRTTGVSPWDYLIRIRVEAAKRLLSDSARSITDIANAVGFGDASHFTKLFKSREGLTPRAWRQEHRPAERG